MIPVVVLGASRLVGQVLLSRLAAHPQFAIRALCDIGEERGPRPYGEVCAWTATPDMPDDMRGLKHHRGSDALLAQLGGPDVLVLSVLPDGRSAPVDRAFAAAGARVITHASDLRLAADVPLVIPDIHSVPADAALVATPNCTTVMVSLFLHPLRIRFGIASVSVVALQALSGADLTGPRAIQMIDTLDPHLHSEACALEQEVDRLFCGAFPLSAQCARVPVTVGHTLFLSFRTEKPATRGEILDCLATFELAADRAKLPTALRRPLVVEDRARRPSPKLDAARDRGMAITIGSLEACPVQGWRCVLVGNNMERGSAATLLLTAEAMAAGQRTREQPPAAEDSEPAPPKS